MALAMTGNNLQINGNKPGRLHVLESDNKKNVGFRNQNIQFRNWLKHKHDRNSNWLDEMDVTIYTFYSLRNIHYKNTYFNKTSP